MTGAAAGLSTQVVALLQGRGEVRAGLRRAAGGRVVPGAALGSWPKRGVLPVGAPVEAACALARGDRAGADARTGAHRGRH